MPNYCQQSPGLGDEHLILDTKHPIFVEIIQMLPKNIKLLPKKNSFSPEISFSSSELQNSKKYPIITKIYILPKTPNPAKKNQVLAKISQYLPHKETSLANKYPFLPQSSEILSKKSQTLPNFLILSKNTQSLSKITKLYKIFIKNISKIRQSCHHLYFSEFLLTIKLFSDLKNINF